MCENCYAEYGRPAIATDTTRHAADLIRAVRELSNRRPETAGLLGLDDPRKV